MPARPLNPARPTFYLDHSTLCDAFRAHAVRATTSAHEAYRPLFGWIERVAREANLCLSLFHLAELARWGDRASADGLARWWEALPTVWVRSITDVEQAEDEHWTKVAAGITPSTPVSGYAPSMLAAMSDLRGDALSALLANKEPILAQVSALRTGPKPRAGTGEISGGVPARRR